MATVPVVFECSVSSAFLMDPNEHQRIGWVTKLDGFGLPVGGLRADLFPSPAELAATLQACVARGVPVKCTAGLHHAVRHTDPATGFPHHGFLNLLTAMAALSSGNSADCAADWLGETDAGALVTAVRSWSAERAARARAVFTSFGTCSVTEPVDDLVALGLLPSQERTIA